MKGRDEFSQQEIDNIRKLLEKKCVATENQQKYIRSQIRDMGFYISDFGETAFGPRDLDRLIEQGIVKVKGRKITPLPINAPTPANMRDDDLYDKNPHIWIWWTIIGVLVLAFLVWLYFI